jgi:hypothetical protein
MPVTFMEMIENGPCLKEHNAQIGFPMILQIQLFNIGN